MTSEEAHVTSESEPGKFDKYKALLEQWRSDRTLHWQIFNAFMVAHILFMGLLGQAIRDSQQLRTYRPGAVVFSILGMVLCIPWATAAIRNHYWWHFRIAQAKAEEPEKWHIVGHDAEQFGNHGEIAIQSNRKLRMPFCAKLGNKIAQGMLISAFLIAYLFILMISWP